MSQEVTISLQERNLIPMPTVKLMVYANGLPQFYTTWDNLKLTFPIMTDPDANDLYQGDGKLWIDPDIYAAIA